MPTENGSKNVSSTETTLGLLLTAGHANSCKIEINMFDGPSAYKNSTWKDVTVQYQGQQLQKFDGKIFLYLAEQYTRDGNLLNF